MSELKADKTFVFGEECEAYKKSEADKVIDFWKNESHNHYERWFSLNKQFEGWFGKVVRCERAERALRHQKYKRCLAMAEVCKHKRWRADVCDEQGYDYARSTKQMDKWLELAEKFKPNNSTAQ